MSEPATNQHPVVRVGVGQPSVARNVPPSETDSQKLIAAVEANIEHTAELVEEAARLGVQILCLPEDVGTMAGHSSKIENLPLSRQVVRATADRVLDTFCAAAARAKIHVVASAFLPEGDLFYNLAFLIDPTGQIIGRYRKTHPTRGEAPLVEAGEEYPVFDTELGRIGILICNDFNFPEPTRILALEGAGVILCPTLGFDYGGEHMGEMRSRSRAFDNTLYLAFSMYGHRAAISPGRSCIIGPQGHFLADAGYTPDVVAWADITPTLRPIDWADPEGKTGSNRYKVWTGWRRPHTYGALVRPLDKKEA